MSTEHNPETQFEHGIVGEVASEESLAQLHRQIGDIMLMYAPSRNIERSLPHTNFEADEFGHCRLDMSNSIEMKGEKRLLSLNWPFVEEDGTENYYYIALSAAAGWAQTEDEQYVVTNFEEELEWDRVHLDCELEYEQAIELLSQLLSDDTAPAAQTSLARYFHDVLVATNKDGEILDKALFAAAGTPLEIWNKVEEQLNAAKVAVDLTCEMTLPMENDTQVSIRANEVSDSQMPFGDDPQYRHIRVTTPKYEFQFSDSPQHKTTEYNNRVDDELELLMILDEPLTDEEEEDNPFDIKWFCDESESEGSREYVVHSSDSTIAPSEQRSFTNIVDAKAYRAKLYRALRIQERNAKDLTETHALAVRGLLHIIESGRAKQLHITETP